MEQLTGILTDRLVLASSVGVILFTVWIFTTLFGPGNNLPLVGKEYGNSHERRKVYLAAAAKLYKQGHEMFRNKPYRLTTTDGERVVVPISALDELRRLPEDHLSMTEQLKTVTESRYTGMTDVADFGFLAHILRSDMTQNMNRILPKIAAEVERTVEEVIGSCDDWTPEVLYGQLSKIIATVSGSVFIGSELCRREEYLHASINYTVDAFRAIGKLKKWHKLLRPVGQYFTPELKKIAEHRQAARKFLIPVISQRRALMADGGELPDDMLQWMMNKAEKLNISDIQLADAQLSLSMAAIHTTTNAANDALCELVVRPEVMADIRTEVRRVLKDHNGVVSNQAIFDMKLLDSVLREAQRTNGLGKIRFPRLVKKPITLHDGSQIPKGYVVEAPYTAIVNDPMLYPEPEEFDAYRFLRLRDGQVEDPIKYTSKEQYQFVTVSKENMGFGWGRHACPGRFFAANELKLLLAQIVVQYDIRMPGGKSEGYSNSGAGSRMSKDPKNSMEFKKAHTKE